MSIKNKPKEINIFTNDRLVTSGNTFSNIHKHIFSEIHIVCEGEINITVEGQTYVLNECSVIVIPANVLHSVKTTRMSLKHFAFMYDSDCNYDEDKIILKKK